MIDGFVATDTIDLKGIGLATSVDYLGTTLTVHQVGGGSFTLGFSDPGLAGHFAVSSDGTGGTNLKFV